MTTLIEGEQALVTTDSPDPNDPNGFYDTFSGENLDPTVVQLRASVNGSELPVWVYGEGETIIRDSKGNYHADLDTTGQVGEWVLGWYSDQDGTDPQVCEAIQVTGFTVIPSPLPSST